MAHHKVTKLKISFKDRIPIAVNNQKMKADTLLEYLNKIMAKSSVGCIDIVENHLTQKPGQLGKNPDVLELVRAQTGLLQGHLTQTTALFNHCLQDTIVIFNLLKSL